MALELTYFTRLAIRVLAIGKKPAEYRIIVHQQADGDVRYSVNVMVDGQRSRDDEVAHYIAAADRMQMADDATGQLPRS